MEEAKLYPLTPTPDGETRRPWRKQMLYPLTPTPDACTGRPWRKQMLYPRTPSPVLLSERRTGGAAERKQLLYPSTRPFNRAKRARPGCLKRKQMLYPLAPSAAANRQVQRTGARLAVSPHATHALGAGGAGLDGSAPHSYTGIPCGPPAQGLLEA